MAGEPPGGGWPEDAGLAPLGRAFARHRGPQGMAAATVVAISARVVLRRWSWKDLIGPVAVVAAQPLTEWVLHVGLLHLRPRTVGGRTIDPLVARKHREHHADPKDVELVLVPDRVVAIALPVTAAVSLARGAVRPRLTALAAGYAMFLAYDWTHFLIHSPHRPTGRWLKRRWRNHRNHHYRNERYWFGVTTTAADALLRTGPARDAVPVSPTARDLGLPA